MESICEKCQNYNRHYFLKNGRFFYMRSGYCSDIKGKPSQRKRVCKSFKQDNDLEFKNTELDLVKGIFRLEKQVNNLVEALKALKQDYLNKH